MGAATPGHYHTLTILREAPQGLYLDDEIGGEILLPKKYVPRDIYIGGTIRVFVYFDSEDRPVATTETPKATVGQFACLKAIGYHPRAGVFLDWGLSKDLLLPLAELKGRVEPGDRVVVHILEDERSGRIIATMKVERYLNLTHPLYADGEEVDLIIFGETPLGYNAIVNHAHRGLLYHTDLNARLEIGRNLRGYVQSVREDGKIDLKLDTSGYQRISPLADKILETLRANQGRLDLNDDSPPEAIRHALGMSKKAFKQALGTLYRERQIRFEGNGIRLST